MNAAPPSTELDMPPEVAAMEARPQRIETPCGDGTMVWRVWGEETGKPVALAHGAQGSWTHWLRNIDALVDAGYRVLAADLPGHGDSAMPATPGHVGISRALADGLRQILGEGRRADLVGFSFGGVAFTWLAAQHPDVAHRVILIGCGGLDTPHGHPDLVRISGLRGEERRAAMKRNLLGLMLQHEDTVDEFALWQLIHNARRARLTVPHLVLPDRLCLILPDVTVPVDAIWGELDRPHPDPAVQEEALRRFKPDADFRVIPEAGHWAMFERPDAFNATLLAMLAGEEGH